MPPKSSSKIIKSLNEGKSFFWQEYLKEIKQGNDRATAILGAVYLDEYLREYIESILVEEKSLALWDLPWKTDVLLPHQKAKFPRYRALDWGQNREELSCAF